MGTLFALILVTTIPNYGESWDIVDHQLTENDCSAAISLLANIPVTEGRSFECVTEATLYNGR